MAEALNRSGVTRFNGASGMSACGQELQWQLVLSLQQELMRAAHLERKYHAFEL